MNAKKWNKMNIQNGFWIDGEQKTNFLLAPRNREWLPGTSFKIYGGGGGIGSITFLFFDRVRWGPSFFFQRETNIWIKIILHIRTHKKENDRDVERRGGQMGGQPESCQLCFHLHILFRFLFHFFVSNRFTRISRIEKKEKRSIKSTFVQLIRLKNFKE